MLEYYVCVCVTFTLRIVIYIKWAGIINAKQTMKESEQNQIARTMV